jgi:uracil-DNA glycosylase family 4
VERGKNPMDPAAAASALQWWADAGVDVMVDEEPRDWLRPKAKAETSVSPPQPGAGNQPAPQAAMRAEPLPDQLELFHAYLRDNQSLPYAAPSAPRVCPSGDPASGLMIVTDMPAAEDCSTGTLLSGEAGRLFDRMLAAIGRDRNSIYLASLSCLRAPDGRFTTAASTHCANLARHHVGLASPNCVLLFGDACSKALLGLPVAKARGRWHRISTHAGDIPALVTFAPSHLLEQPSAKRLAWADLQMLVEGPTP